MNFHLHPQLKKDCIEIGRFELSRLLLMNDSQYPWCILVPERSDVTEIYQLSRQERVLLQEESCLLSETLAEIYQADKMNVAAIGNLVPQLHIHHLVRYKTDRTWPAPVWGKAAAIPYSDSQLEENIEKIQTALKHELKAIS